MIRRMAWLSLLLLSATSAAGADESVATRLVGTNPGSFKLKNATTGARVDLESFRGKKATVLVFLGVDCPVGNQYVPRLADIARKYEPKGVVVLGINSNIHEPADRVAAHAKEFSISFPVLKDEGTRVADLLRAERTCEVVLLDEKGIIRYRGAIDDQYGYGIQRPDRAVKHQLTDAIDAVLAGKAVEFAGTTVVGCLIDRTDNRAPKVNARKIRASTPVVNGEHGDEPKIGSVTYASDVASIVQNRCQNCHRPKAAAPFSLLSYDDARRWSATIREAVDERRMPPWHADPRYGHFANDRRLSARERATLVAWVEQGTPLGDPRQLPRGGKAFPDGWAVGEPDAVYQMPQECVVPADGVVRYQYFPIALNLKEDKWLQSIECLPGDRTVVHHIIAFMVAKGGGGGVYLGGYAPGELPSVYNPGIAKRLPANSSIVLEVHYTPMGKIRKDRSKVGLIFAKTPPEHEGITHAIENRKLVINPGDDNAEIRSQFTFASDSHLLSFMPHMHLRGKDFRYLVTYPGKKPEILLSVPDFDFAWQSVYRLTEPLFVPKGTVIDCIAHFDNSTKNPANPDPTATVRWGDQTFEEMMSGFIDYYRDEPIRQTVKKAEKP